MPVTVPATSKKQVKKLSLFEDISPSELRAVLTFIDAYWDRIIHPARDSHNDPHTIPLPHTFITTNAKETSHWGGVMFYWDSFFMFRGIVATKWDWIMPKMVDNFSYLLEKFGIIPNANKWAFLDRSQPPFYSSMIFDAYYSIQRSNKFPEKLRQQYSKAWLKKHMQYAKREYNRVWEDSDYYHHKIPEFNLSRYGDRDVGYSHSSELESGWDLTSRFYGRCNDFLAVDLNSYLHKYEKDFAKAANILGDRNDEEYWEQKARQRHNSMKKYMWNEKEGFFFDYDYDHNLQSEFYSLAGFVPMWAKLATYAEAQRMLKKLPLFETEYGLTVTAKASLPPKMKFDHVPAAFRYSIEEIIANKQWDYPNIWPPLEYLTVIGLLRYGFLDDAVRIMQKSIKANISVFKRYGALLEKLDARTGEKPKDYWYPSQLGFGWTNAIFYRYIQILKFIEEKNGDIYTLKPGQKEPPYSLTGILH